MQAGEYNPIIILVPFPKPIGLNRRRRCGAYAASRPDPLGDVEAASAPSGRLNRRRLAPAAARMSPIVA